MIPFLVKLANLLDERGQHKMAREVDDLIEKLAQQIPEFPVEPRQPSWQTIPKVAPEQAPAKKPGKSVVKLIQQAVGAPASGKWDPTTNSAFIAYMNKYLPVAMKDNVFVGPVIDDKGTRAGNTLADAWALIKEQGSAQQELAQEMANKPPQQDMASKAPAAQNVPIAKNWVSKHFQITPAAQQALKEIEKHWPGTAQQEINKLDQQKETGTAGKHMDQGIFEEMLTGRSKPA